MVHRAPFASSAGTYTNSTGTFSIPDGPTSERPIIRYRGQYLKAQRPAVAVAEARGLRVHSLPRGITGR